MSCANRFDVVEHPDFRFLPRPSIFLANPAPDRHDVRRPGLLRQCRLMGKERADSHPHLAGVKIEMDDANCLEVLEAADDWANEGVAVVIELVPLPHPPHLGGEGRDFEAIFEQDYIAAHEAYTPGPDNLWYATPAWKKLITSVVPVSLPGMAITKLIHVESCPVAIEKIFDTAMMLRYRHFS